MKSKLNTVLLCVLVACLSILLTLLMVYFVMTSSRSTEQQANVTAGGTQDTDTSMPAEPAAADPAQQTSEEESSVVYKQVFPLKTEDSSSQAEEAETDSASAESRPEQKQPSQQPSDEDKIFYLFDNTPIYLQPIDGSLPVTDFPDAYSQGLYTGKDYPIDMRFKQIDYLDRKALVPADSLMEMGNAKIMPTSVISQITASNVGYSGCGPACLHMMEYYSGIKPQVAGISSYDQLLDYAQTYGYNDQGSLYGSSGGMTCDSLMRLAHDVYGIELGNFYGYDSNRPSDLIKALLDDGRQAIVLIHQMNGEIVESSNVAHFVLFTGYIENDGIIEFVYANSYHEMGSGIGYPLQSATADIVDASVSSAFADEPNAILFIR